MGFPNKKEINKILKQLEKAKGSLALQPNATPLEKFRWDICQKFIKYEREHGYNQTELAATLGIDKSKMSKILHHRIDEFSTDRLLTLYQKINPKVKLKVS
ncbi:MAG: XRE family transcriptional regulator [Bdellovibrionota bacterium]